WKFEFGEGNPPGLAGTFGYASTTTRYVPGSGNVTSCVALPSAAIGGWWWMIAERSSRTMIRWTPVCGPGPRLKWTSGSPFGWRTVKETVVERPARAGSAGRKPWSSYTFAASIVGKPSLDEPPQAATKSAATART